MKSLSVLPMLGLALALAGCSAAGLDSNARTVATTTGPESLPIVDSIPSNGRVISDINISLCQATAGDAPHTVDEATRALKLAASRAGATGIANVTSGVVTQPTSKCVSMAQATGIAFVQG